MNDNMQILSYIYIRELNNTPHTNIYAKEIHTDTENQNSFANVLPYTHILTPHHTHTLCTFFKSPFSVLTIHTPFSLSLSLSSLLQCIYTTSFVSSSYLRTNRASLTFVCLSTVWSIVLYFFKRADDSRLGRLSFVLCVQQ